ncbi:hypothetical protein As57867_020526, partial [Aphanomyces stellatus]
MVYLSTSSRWLIAMACLWCTAYLVLLRYELMDASSIFVKQASSKSALRREGPESRDATTHSSYHTGTSLPSLLNDTTMQAKSVAAMKWAWKGYQAHAYGFDALNVQTMGTFSAMGHDMALTLVDSLDTLYLLGMMDEFNEAADWAEANMMAKHQLQGYVSAFETTIRALGGYLAAYQLSGRPGFLALADDLGTRLSRPFREVAFPRFQIDLVDGVAIGRSCLAEFTTIQLEFKYLARLTGKIEYADAVEAIMDR